jgi:hypothetical protein
MFVGTFNLEQERGLENVCVCNFGFEQERGLESVCVCNFGLKQNHNATWRRVWNNKKSCYKNTTKFASFLSEFFFF